MAPFSVTIEGQPPSVNHSYHPIKKPMRDSFGQPIYSADGRQIVRMGLAKTKTVKEYQQLVVWRTRQARPSGWRHGGGWIRMSYRFYLTRRMDCDNALKALNDAIADALGIDDFWMLPCVISKTVSRNETPRVEVTIEDESEQPSAPPNPDPSGSPSLPHTHSAPSASPRPSIRG